MPRPTAACAALADLLRRISTGAGFGGCTVGAPRRSGSPESTAILSGVFRGRAVHLTLESDYTWCGKSLPALRDLWTLSTFPCNIPVLHSAANSNAGSSPPESWARRTGCRNSAHAAATS